MGKAGDIPVAGAPRGRTGRCKRILLECTYTHLYGGNTGIQRVVRNVINNAARVGRNLGVQCQPIVWTGRYFQPTDKVLLQPKDLRWLIKKLLSVFPDPIPRALTWLPRKLRLPGFYDRLLGWLVPCIRRLKGDIVTFRAGDVLFLLDFSWLVPLWPGVQQAKRSSARVGATIYDLVPIRFPETCNQELLWMFRKWFEQACSQADFFVAISRTVANECRQHLASLDGGAREGAPVGYFYLGCNLDQRSGAGPIRPRVRQVLEESSAKPYLSVATLEPRKNHRYLLDAFDKVWSQGVQAPLCLVGRPGWQCHDIERRIHQHPLLDKRLFLFSDLNDEELLFCYDRAKALIFPSFYEGFGLPIVEALSRGCRVLASDIPIHREVGGEYCVYFDLGSPDRLADLIVGYEKTGRLPPVKPLDGYRWQDWSESCAQLIRVLMEMA